MRGLEEWRNLLIGAREPFKILMDHQNLIYFKDPQKLTGQQVNWNTKLQDYDFVIKDIGGELNSWADVLSRPEGAEKVSAKVGTVLSERLFVKYLSGRDRNKEERVNHTQEIMECHDSPSARHPGVKRTLNLLMRKGWKWPGMHQDVQTYVKGCIICQKTRPQAGKNTNPLNPILLCQISKT
jgi:hypothetical protein